MEFKNVITSCVTIAFCTMIWAFVAMDDNDPAEIAAMRQIEQIKLEQIRVQENQETSRLKITESKGNDLKIRQMQEMRTLVQQGVSPFAARCMVVGVGNTNQQKRCLQAGAKPVKK